MDDRVFDLRVPITIHGLQVATPALLIHWVHEQTSEVLVRVCPIVGERHIQAFGRGKQSGPGQAARGDDRISVSQLLACLHDLPGNFFLGGREQRRGRNHHSPEVRDDLRGLPRP